MDTPRAGEHAAPPTRDVVAGRVLLAEDEARLASFMERGLRREGLDVEVVGDGDEALARVARGGVDLLVLDLGLPGTDGWEVLRTLRGTGSRLPVLVLTGRRTVEDRVAGLEAGADDYLTKPFAFEELLARVRTRLRDRGGEEGVRRRHGDVVLDLAARTVTTADGVVALSAREFALAELLLRHAPDPVSRERILSEVWGYDFDPDTNVVNVYVAYLRRKVGVERIETVRGVGYRWCSRPPPGAVPAPRGRQW